MGKLTCISIDEIVDVDAVILTYLHLDHYDDAAKEAIPKHIKVFAQNQEEAESVKNDGFEDVDYLREEGSCLLQNKSAELCKEKMQRTALY